MTPRWVVRAVLAIADRAQAWALVRSPELSADVRAPEPGGDAELWPPSVPPLPDLPGPYGQTYRVTVGGPGGGVTSWTAPPGTVSALIPVRPGHEQTWPPGDEGMSWPPGAHGEEGRVTLNPYPNLDLNPRSSDGH